MAGGNLEDVPAMALSITDNQNTQVIAPVDSNIDAALSAGVSAPSTPTVLNGITGYSTLPSGSKTAVKDSFRLIIAAIIKVLNIDRPLPSTKFNGTVALAKLTSGGTNGSLTVVDGLITNYTAPT